MQAGGKAVINSNLDFGGLLDLSQELEVLSKAESRQVLRKAVRAGAQVVRDEIEARAPVKTGKLARNIVVSSGRAPAGEAVAGVRIRGVNPAGTNSDTTTKANNRNNAFYWRFVELGTSKMAAHPFVRPAYDARQEEASQAAFAEMAHAIDEVLAK